MLLYLVVLCLFMFMGSLLFSGAGGVSGEEGKWEVTGKSRGRGIAVGVYCMRKE